MSKGVKSVICLFVKIKKNKYAKYNNIRNEKYNFFLYYTEINN